MGPLHGLRIIELAGIGPVPRCCMLLADLGADVVRIDRLQPSGLGLAMERRFDVNARNRRSLALDLKVPAGRDAALRLVLGPMCWSKASARAWLRAWGWGRTSAWR